ncbi:threonylcarbamoyl-AMP synthase [Candidatus Woesearchaeota archaeon]|nr:threonylcarbamoyl-AMP synthase [Candidatus Woesearchaeota archaeon]
MRVLTKDEFKIEKMRFFDKIVNGAIFIYPTDTIYGIGCDATNRDSVKKIRKIKNRPENPFSVIAPSVQWIEENCIINDTAKEWLEKLPGPYTLVLKLKNKNCVAPEVIPKTESIGVRMPQHWFSAVIRLIDTPIVTTSVNEAGKKFMSSIEDLDSEIKTKVDFMIDEGEKQGKPSNVIYLDKEEVMIRDRQSGAAYDQLQKV